MNGMRRSKHNVSRPLDYLYDPNFHVSDARDHQKAALESFSRIAEYQICPKFSTMFSDSRNYPPACIKVKCLDRVPPCVDRSWKGVGEKSPARIVDVTGSHRHLFYRRPNVSSLTLVAMLPEDQKETEDKKINEEKSEKTEMEIPRSRTLAIQTDYRESETQTTPFSPDVVIRDQTGDPPVILSLKNLKWGKGLPPGLHEIENIEWEINHREVKAYLLDPNNVPESKRPAILEYIHREEWLHREQEIQGIHDLRMDLAEELMHKRGEDLSDRLQDIVKRRYKKKLEENRKKVMKIRETHQRELRKLINKQKGISMKYKRPDPVTEQADYSSELYGPLMRHGVDPRRRHEVPLSLRSKFLYDYKGLEVLEQAAKWMKTPRLAPLKEKSVDNELCARGTRWSYEQLDLLQKYFKGLVSELEGEESKSLPKLMVPVPKPSPRPITPSMDDAIPESEEKLYQAAVFMQKLIRGRAIQMLMFKGKEKAQDMIDELQTTHSLLSKGQNALREEKVRTLLEYENELEEKRNDDAYENMLSMLVGDTVGAMLDFLAKELVRLKDERCIHALLLLAQRERHRREAEEAGRRQTEERRRREHDEVFKQAVKVHQETVDVYLEDIVLNAMEWVATAESRSYIKELARNIDQKTKDIEDRKNIWECKELVTDIVYDYMLPEVYKELLDQDREKEQQHYLQAIQDEVYKTLADPEREDLQAPTPLTGEEELGNVEYEHAGEEDESVQEIPGDATEEEREGSEMDGDAYVQVMQEKVLEIVADSVERDQQSPGTANEDKEPGGGVKEDTGDVAEAVLETVNNEREKEEQYLQTETDEKKEILADPMKDDWQIHDVKPGNEQPEEEVNELTEEEGSSLFDGKQSEVSDSGAADESSLGED